MSVSSATYHLSFDAYYNTFGDNVINGTYDIYGPYGEIHAKTEAIYDLDPSKIIIAGDERNENFDSLEYYLYSHNPSFFYIDEDGYLELINFTQQGYVDANDMVRLSYEMNNDNSNAVSITSFSGDNVGNDVFHMHLELDYFA